MSARTSGQDGVDQFLLRCRRASRGWPVPNPAQHMGGEMLETKRHFARRRPCLVRTPKCFRSGLLRKAGFQLGTRLIVRRSICEDAAPPRVSDSAAPPMAAAADIGLAASLTATQAPALPGAIRDTRRNRIRRAGCRRRRPSGGRSHATGLQNRTSVLVVCCVAAERSGQSRNPDVSLRRVSTR